MKKNINIDKKQIIEKNKKMLSKKIFFKSNKYRGQKVNYMLICI